MVQGGIAGIAYNARNNDPIKALEFGMQYAGNKQKSDMYNKLLAKETGEPYRPNFFGGLTKDDYGSVTGANYKANSLLLRQQANQIRLDKEFPVYKDYLDGKLLSGEITEDEHDLLVKKADQEDKLFSRRNRGVVDQMIKQLHYKNTEEETKRHNKTTEGIQQQNADTKVGQYKETVRNNNVKNNQTQQKIDIKKSSDRAKQEIATVQRLDDKGNAIGNTIRVTKAEAEKLKKDKRFKIIYD